MGSSAWHARSGTSPFRDEPLPVPDEFDRLVVMGGPMSVHDEREYPWLTREKALIGQALEGGKSVLGICLGAQLFASVLGTRVYRAREKEIGWFPVRLRPEARRSPASAGWPDSFTPFHWHGETFDLPAGATHLVGTDVCPNQAFEYAGRAVGVQFHLEVAPSGVAELIGGCRADLQGGGFVQPGQEVCG
ncbi:MAG TPA: type 1 glutamine amidotransferase [Urbifossiella sp.]|nr:type 1 glutamine amidotransferase [Urbifossiella sp.]